MKAEVKSKEKEFQPIAIEIVIESEEELVSLYHRIGIDNDAVNRALVATTMNECRDELDNLFEILSDKITELKLHN